MRNIIISIPCVFLLFLVSCQSDDNAKSGHVQFTFSTRSATKSSGRRQADVIPDGASLVIGLSKSNGDTVFTWKTIALLKIGDQFITEPLPLLPGGYVINDFMIRSSNNTLVFIAPKGGSSLASLVTKPLPISFSVTANSIANTEVEVVNADHQNPEDFGYAAFPIKVIPGSGFPVSTFIVNEEGHTQLTTAKAYILHEDDTLLMQKLGATINNVNWNKGSDDRFSLIITKDGYARYQKTFSLDSMNMYLNGKPLPIVLEPAFTILWSPWQANEDNLNLQVEGTPGSKLRIDWGDGSIQNYEFTQHPDEIHHRYTKHRKYFFSVTGDLPAITYLGFFYTTSQIDTLSLVHLPNLLSFEMGFFDYYYGTGIDFSHNPKLQFLDLSYLGSNITTIDISKNPALTLIEVSVFKNITTPMVDKLIDDLYRSVATNNTRNGVLNLIAVHYDDPTLVGPPSPDRVAKLYSLINDYGWKVYPLVSPF